MSRQSFRLAFERGRITLVLVLGCSCRPSGELICRAASRYAERRADMPSGELICRAASALVRGP